MDNQVYSVKLKWTNTKITNVNNITMKYIIITKISICNKIRMGN